MKEYLEYMLETVVCSGLFYGFYRLLLDGRAGFGLCRVYLLLSIVLSAVIPMLDMAVLPPRTIAYTPVSPTGVGDMVLQDAELAGNRIPYSALLSLYIAISLFALFRIFSRIRRIDAFKKEARVYYTALYTLYTSMKVESPFSFFAIYSSPTGSTGRSYRRS